MARHLRKNYRPYVRADNGLEWDRDRCTSILSVSPVMYMTRFDGLGYMIQKYRVPDGGHGWYLYLQSGRCVQDEPFGSLLLPAIDAASELIVKQN